MYGITINYEKLINGMYQECINHPDSACMVYGMLPAQIMDALEKGLKERIPDKFYKKGYPLAAIDGKSYRGEIMHAVACGILDLAKQNNILQA